jgi:hypothetical protein
VTSSNESIPAAAWLWQGGIKNRHDARRTRGNHPPCPKRHMPPNNRTKSLPLAPRHASIKRLTLFTPHLHITILITAMFSAIRSAAPAKALARVCPYRSLYIMALCFVSVIAFAAPHHAPSTMPFLGVHVSIILTSTVILDFATRSRRLQAHLGRSTGQRPPVEAREGRGLAGVQSRLLVITADLLPNSPLRISHTTCMHIRLVC